ncbi:PAS domain S-box protein [Verrucomicrobiales bacterium BCK34]|nr:PAS domain S-box protein [Verrucomicrobiales bacterium BCK34]
MLSSSPDSTTPSSSQNPEDWSRMIVESAPNGIIVMEKGGQIVLSNEKARLLFGYSASEFVELKVEDLIPERNRKLHVEERAGYHKNPKGRAMGDGRDLWALRKDGSEFPVEIGLTPLSVPGKELVLSSVIDITARKEAERLLQDYADELKFRAEILNNVHDAVFYFDGHGMIQEWNEGANRLFGYALAEIKGEHISLICVHGGRKPFSKIENRIRKEGVVEEIIHCRDKNDREVFVRATVKIMNRDGEFGYLVCASDITERRKLEAELLKVAEEQQRKIGQDIHDDLCSQLSGIGCLTKVLENQLAEDHRRETDMMRDISEMVANAGATARQIAHGLVPSVLENQGLVDALAELIAMNRKSYGIDIQLSISDRTAINGIESETAVQVYRIAQEAISNANRHSDAESISVSASIKNRRFELAIRDDGRGMSEDLVSMGLGLATMRRRANLIHAAFDIHASPGEGTVISCSVPLSTK